MSQIVRVDDKYGEYGLVGVLFHHVAEEEDTLVLDNLLMSCRVLGRGVEHRMIAELGNVALSKGASKVEMRFEATDRNMPAGRFLKSVSLFPGNAEDEEKESTAGMLSKSFPANTVAKVAFDPANVSHYGAEKKKAGSAAGTNGVAVAVRGEKRPADYNGIAREEARRTTTKVSKTPTNATDETKTDGSSVRAACLSALSTVLGPEAAAAAAADGARSFYALGLDSLMMVRIFGRLKKCGAIKDGAEITPTDLQRASTLDQWLSLLSSTSAPASAKNRSDQCMFKIKGSNAPGKASLVFLHPAGGAIGPFNKMFRALGEDREIWGIEHPFFVNDSFHPASKTLGETGTAYADAIIDKLRLNDQHNAPGTSSKKWVLITYSAGGLWTNETFHQLRMRGNAPHLVVLLDAGWGIVTGPWDYPCCCGGACCCRLDCAPCPLCEPCHTLCEGMFALIQCCWTPCQRCRYHGRNPSRNPNQPLTYNDTYKPAPMSEAAFVGMLDAPYDFFRLGSGPGRLREEENPVKMIMSRDPPLEEKTLEAATAKIRKYMDEEFGEEGQGAKFERMAGVMTQGTMAHLFSVKAVPFGDTPLAVYQAKRPMMRTVESVYQTRDHNIVDQAKFVVDLELEGFDNIFKNDPPGGRAHQLFTSDDKVVAQILERWHKVMEDLEL
jgi:aryl carrier-like protein